MTSSKLPALIGIWATLFSFFSLNTGVANAAEEKPVMASIPIVAEQHSATNSGSVTVIQDKQNDALVPSANSLLREQTGASGLTITSIDSEEIQLNFSQLPRPLQIFLPTYLKHKKYLLVVTKEDAVSKYIFTADNEHKQTQNYKKGSEDDATSLLESCISLEMHQLHEQDNLENTLFVPIEDVTHIVTTHLQHQPSLPQGLLSSTQLLVDQAIVEIKTKQADESKNLLALQNAVSAMQIAQQTKTSDFSALEQRVKMHTTQISNLFSQVKQVQSEVKSDISKATTKLTTAVSTINSDVDSIKQMLGSFKTIISGLVATNNSFSYTWTLGGISNKRKLSLDSSGLSFWSPVFHTRQSGHDMYLRTHMNVDQQVPDPTDEDEEVTKKFISLYLIIVKDREGTLPKWLLQNKVRLSVINQTPSMERADDYSKTYSPHLTNSAENTQKVRTCSTAVGLTQYAEVELLSDAHYLKDDTLLIKVDISTAP